MKDDKKILFMVDHKYRDLPALSLIAHHMKQRGCDARLVALGLEEPVIESFDPGFIVIPKPNYNYVRLIDWKRQGRKIIVIDTEGNHQDKLFIHRIHVAPDLYCFWNEEVKERYRELLEKCGSQVKVLGFLRGDFLHRNYIDIFPSREELLISYGLDPKKKTITIATSTQDSHFSKDRLKKKGRRRKKNYSNSADYLDIVNNMCKLRDLTERLIKHLKVHFPEINILIKPHPNESVVYWNELISKIGATNIGLVVGEPINHLLTVSDLHVAHNVCTTTIESMMFGIPTMEIHTDKSESLYKAEHLFMANYLLRRPEDITFVVEEVFMGKATDRKLEQLKNSSDLESYVAKYFYKHDGNRCQEYAQSLQQYMTDQPRDTEQLITWLLKHPRHIVPYYLHLIWYFFRKLNGLDKQYNIEREVNNPSKTTSRKCYEINGKLVDKEYGLFDNRMKQGDEQLWFDKFSSLMIPKPRVTNPRIG